MAVVKTNQCIIAFANVVEDFVHEEEFRVDLMRHAAEAPHGAMDFLFVSLLQHAQSADYHWFDLGMAPLSGVGSSPWSPREERMLKLMSSTWA